MPAGRPLRRLVLAAALALALCAGPALARTTFMAFGGGPAGGTFQYFANAMALYIQGHVGGLSLTSEASGGSLENLKHLNAGAIDYAVAYMGDAYLGRKGALPEDPAKLENVRAVAFLYGAPAQLVVRAGSSITDVKGLAGKRVAVGNAGSGAAIACERYLGQLGLWDKIDKQFLGYAPAAAAFAQGKIDAFWLLVGYPNATIAEAAAATPIRLIDLGAPAQDSAFYEAFPFYSPTTIPAGTYAGQSSPVASFQDAAYWMASKEVSPEIVYASVAAVFSPDGLATMVAAHKAAREMTIPGALAGLAVPLHPGAARFWQEQGLSLPAPVK